MMTIFGHLDNPVIGRFRKCLTFAFKLLPEFEFRRIRDVGIQDKTKTVSTGCCSLTNCSPFGIEIELTLNALQLYTRPHTPVL